MKPTITLLAFAFFIFQFAMPASAQIGTCEPSIADATLEGGNVRARILNNGALFWRGSPSLYEAPIGIGANSIFAANIWIAGYIEDDIRVSASHYGPWEFWSGPLDEAGNPPQDCTQYDKIWEIKKEDIVDFLQDGIISQNLREWPWQLGAPVVDGDGNLHNYNLEGGDLPELLGDQRLWWIMNDRGNKHEYTRSQPIGLEVHASAFVFDQLGPLGTFTYYDYKLINKNTAPFEDAFFGLYTDVDLGDFSNDYVGSDSLLHLGYGYNAEATDIDCGFDAIPPAVGFTYLETVVADNDGLDNDRDGEFDEPGEMLGTSSVFYYVDGGDIIGQPLSKEDYHSHMQARWRDGSALLEGGWIGHKRSTSVAAKTTKFSYSGDPISKTGWSEFNIDGLGTANYQGDRRLLTSTGSFDIAPGDTANIRFAIVWAQGEDHLDSVRLLKSYTAGVRSSAEQLYAYNDLTDEIATPFEQAPLLGFGQNFPNPFTQSTTISYDLPKPMQVRLAVYDMLGREINVLVNTHQQAGNYAIDFDADNLPAGVYLARIGLDHLQFTQRMILMR